MCCLPFWSQCRVNRRDRPAGGSPTCSKYRFMLKQVAIQGIIGSYHEIAARKFFCGEEIDLIGCDTFR
ncbi:MAG: hypothetical protein LBL62_08225, partial [Planctomycetaceae bacterium]|nr:hypothetical protein [Planctomycetaceae bacterium]